MPDSPAERPALVVLVHGAWHGAWCWSVLQSELDRRGVASLAIDLPGHGASPDPLTGLYGDADHVASVLDGLTRRDSGPIVLVGHSYGGAVVSQVAVGRGDVAHLVYVAAFALTDGESVLGALGSFPERTVDLAAAMVPTDDGESSVLDPAAAPGALYGECPSEVIDAAIARVSPQTRTSMIEAVSGSVDVRSTYVVCRRDRAVHPDHQTIMAGRCDEVVELDTDHSPFLSTPSELADVVERAARSAAVPA